MTCKTVLTGLALVICVPSTLATYTFLNVPNRADYAFTPSGVLNITDGAAITRYDLSTHAFLTPFNIGGTLRGIDLSPDGTTLAVADAITQGNNNRIGLVNAQTGVVNFVSFPLAFGETGTYMTAWGSDNRLLVTSSFGGSGWVPLRRYDPENGVTTTIASVRQNTMLTPSADRNTIGLAESDISSGPVHAYDVATGTYGASINTNWFTAEVAVSRDGSQFMVPTYNGGLLYRRAGNTFVPDGILGAYASHGPRCGVFSPVNNILFTAEYDWNTTLAGVKVYDTNTWALLDTIDPYPFSWTDSNRRMEISPDGHWLAVSVTGGTRLYDVSAYIPEPTTAILLALAACVNRRKG